MELGHIPTQFNRLGHLTQSVSHLPYLEVLTDYLRVFSLVSSRYTHPLMALSWLATSSFVCPAILYVVRIVLDFSEPIFVTSRWQWSMTTRRSLAPSS